MYDFDQTLAPKCMQEPLFKKYGIKGEKFWEEKNAWVKAEKAKGINLDFEFAYLNLMLKYVREGKFPGLSNAELKELGKEIEFYPGLPEFFSGITETIEQENNDVQVEHYVITTGIRQMVEGSKIGPYLDGIFASEFLEEEQDGQNVISGIARAIGFIKKTEYIHLINKGGNVDTSIDINGMLPPEQRRVPFENMFFIGDGFTDIPCFATLNHRGGTSLGVYNPQVAGAKEQADKLFEQGRVRNIHPADYRMGSSLYETMIKSCREMVGKMGKT